MKRPRDRTIVQRSVGSRRRLPIKQPGRALLWRRSTTIGSKGPVSKRGQRKGAAYVQLSTEAAPGRGTVQATSALPAPAPAANLFRLVALCFSGMSRTAQSASPRRLACVGAGRPAHMTAANRTRTSGLPRVVLGHPIDRRELLSAAEIRQLRGRPGQSKGGQGLQRLQRENCKK
jgi:hypothetical protein